jgi:hypothetical protein
VLGPITFDDKGDVKGFKYSMYRRFASEMEPARRFVFLGKAAIYSAGVTFMSFFAKENRYLARGTRTFPNPKARATPRTLPRKYQDQRPEARARRPRPCDRSWRGRERETPEWGSAFERLTK